MAEETFDKLNLAMEFTEALATIAMYQGATFSRTNAKAQVLIRVFPFLGRYRMKSDGPLRWKAEDSNHPELAIVFTRRELAEIQIRDWILEELND